MYELILWIVICLSVLINILFAIKSFNDDKIYELQNRFISDLINSLMNNAKDVSLDDVFFTEDGFNE